MNRSKTTINRLNNALLTPYEILLCLKNYNSFIINVILAKNLGIRELLKLDKENILIQELT